MGEQRKKVTKKEKEEPVFPAGNAFFGRVIKTLPIRRTAFAVANTIRSPERITIGNIVSDNLNSFLSLPLLSVGFLLLGFPFLYANFQYDRIIGLRGSGGFSGWPDSGVLGI